MRKSHINIARSKYIHKEKKMFTDTKYDEAQTQAYLLHCTYRGRTQK